MNHQDDRDEADKKLAKQAEKWRDGVSKGEHGAHKPCEQVPMEEAREAASVPLNEEAEGEKP
jgi:hypothetical protein